MAGGDTGGSGAGGSGAGGSGAGGSGAGGSGAGGSGAGGSGAGGSGAGGSGAGGSGAGGSAGGGTAALAGDTCANPIAITAAGTLTGSTVAALPDYWPQSSSTCKVGDGHDLVYQVSVPAASRMIVTATPLTSSFDLVLNVVSDATSCAGASGVACLDGVDEASAGRPETLTFSNGGSARTVLLMVDGWQQRDLGSFSLSVAFQPLVAGDVCDLPIQLTPGTPLMTQTLGGFADDYAVSSEPRCEFHSGIDRTYSVIVPAGQRLTATVTPVGFDASLTAVLGSGNCRANVCLAGAESGSSGVAETLRWDNLTTTAQTMLLVVDSISSSAGSFAINTTLTASPPAIVGGSSCTAPVPLDAGTFISATTGASNFDFYEEAGCVSSSRAPDSVFSVTIPPNSLVRTTVTPDGWDAIINVISTPAACGITLDAGTLAATCSTSSDGPQRSSVETVTVRNSTATATTALLVVDGHQDTESGAFTISQEILPLANMSGDVCTAPQVITSSGLLSGLTTINYLDDVETASSCTNYQNRGADRVFSVSVPAGSQLTAVVVPNGWDASIYLLDPSQCGTNATCLDGSDSSISGAETARFSNSGTSARTVLIVVDAYSSSASGTFDLITSLTP